ncbi:MAG: hypothetical protein ACP5HM_09290 [Anaerolineae bacterium]
MFSEKKLKTLLQAFPPQERDLLLEQAETYEMLLHRFPRVADLDVRRPKPTWGILALNGASGAGQSYVMTRVERFLHERAIELPRIYLLGTRDPRPGEGYKNPYIFVRETEDGYQDIYHPERVYTPDDIYYAYESRPGARNAILLADAQAARKQVMYLETVIPTLLHLKTTPIAGLPPWGNDLHIVYLAVPSGAEWVYRLLNREPERLKEDAFREQILGRTTSSLADMEVAAEHEIPCVLNPYHRADEAAQEILNAWGL